MYILGSMCLLCSLYSCFDYTHKIGLLNTVGEGGVHDVPVLEEFTQFMVVGERCFLQWCNSRFCKQPPSKSLIAAAFTLPTSPVAELNRKPLVPSIRSNISEEGRDGAEWS